MNRNERKSTHDLLKVTHAQKEPAQLSTGWRNRVMADISQCESEQSRHSDWEQLAPRFTMAAAAISIVLLIMATWTLETLSGDLYTAYANETLGISTSLSSL